MGAAIKSEIRKVFTTRLWWGLLIGVFVLDAGLSALFGSLVGSTVAGNDPATNPFLHPSVGVAQLVYSAGFAYLLSPLFPLTLGVLLITSEFRHKTITATFLAVPRRGVVVVAKIIAVVVVGTVYAVIHDVAVVAGGGGVLALKGESTYLGAGDVWQTLAVSILCFVCWALLGFGFGMLVQNQVAALLIAIGIAFVAQIALQIVFGVLNWDTPGKFLPSNLSLGMLVTNDPTQGAGGNDSPYFVWWVNALILSGYGLVLSAVGSWITARRDIS